MYMYICIHIYPVRERQDTELGAAVRMGPIRLQGNESRASEHIANDMNKNNDMVMV